MVLEFLINTFTAIISGNHISSAVFIAIWWVFMAEGIHQHSSVDVVPASVVLVSALYCNNNS
jgi:hypothetical protein